MKVAVLMSAYNGEKYIKDQIESILDQDFDGTIDLYIRDDGSTDNTINILEDYSSKGKLKYIKANNMGATKSFLNLLKEIQGYDFYSFSDQDDVWDKDKITRAISKILDNDKPTIYCSNCMLVDENLNAIGRNTHREKPTYNLISILCLASCAQGCTSVLNNKMAEIIQENNIPDNIIMHDSLMTCLCALIGGNIIYDHESTMQYRMHSNNVFGMVTMKQNFKSLIKDRLSEIFTQRKISMSDQTKSIVDNYKEYISDENVRIAQDVIDCKHSLFSRFKLVFNRNLKHDTLNKTITKKLQILFGNS